VYKNIKNGMQSFLKISSLFIAASLLHSCKKETRGVDFSADLINTDNLIKEVINEIHNNYADNIVRERLEIGAINGMLTVLDEHSIYINKDEFNIYNQSARGSFWGIGIEIKQVKDGIEISSVIDETPAAKGGIKPLDVITHINGKDVSDVTLKALVSNLNSDFASKINLSILRNKSERLEISLKKSPIQIKSVKLSFIDDIAIIKISHFNENTLLSVSQAIRKVNKKKSLGVVIDLRNNPGGILEQAIGISDLFLVNKKITELKSKNIQESRSVFSDDFDLLNGIPMAILINSNTASGAELMASALGENKRAVLIGEKTHGKGSLQTMIPIPGRGAIKLTTAYFISPLGNMINQKGVAPDIEIEKNQTNDSATLQNADSVILRAMDLLHGIFALNETENKK
jgi:carboxyl-terminal processing protease